MTVDIEKLPECRAKLSAAIPADTVEETRTGVISAFMTQGNLPGFRPGKLPRKVVEKKFGPKIEEELKERLVRSVMMEAYSSEDLAILGVASVERDAFETDGTFSYISEVVVRPEVELTEDEYKNIPVEIEVKDVDEEMIQEFFGRIQKNFAEFEDSDGEVEPGGKALVTFTSTIDGKPALEEVDDAVSTIVHAESEYDLMIPEVDQPGQEMIPGLAEGLIGAKAGETREVNVDFGEEYFREELVGAEAVYTVEVIKVQKANIPEMDDELARKLNVESVEALRENYTMEMSNQLKQQREQQIESAILEHINKEHEFDLPEQEVYNETQYEVNRVYTDAVQRGATPDMLEEHEKDIVDGATARAAANLRTRYLLEAIASNEEIEVDDDELRQQIMFQAYQAQKPPKKFARELRDGPGFDAFRLDILISKTIAFLKENANITMIGPDGEPIPEEKNSSDEEE